jgi:hypothetical protein
MDNNILGVFKSCKVILTNFRITSFRIASFRIASFQITSFRITSFWITSFRIEQKRHFVRRQIAEETNHGEHKT